MKMKNRNRMRNRKGFSLIEVIIAVAILGVVSLSIVVAMTSSSKVYSKSSVEAQMQSEAELVSNSISELVIDARDALDEATTEWMDTLSVQDKAKLAAYDGSKGKILILLGIENVGTAGAPVYRNYQYVVARKIKDASGNLLTSDDSEYNCLFQAKRVQNGDNSYANFDGFHLLGNHIEDFSVDASGVTDKNLLVFDLGYLKTDKKYAGKYQVMMRNKAYAKNEPEEAVPDSEIKLNVSIQPRYLYLAVKQGEVREYYEGAVVDTPEYKKTMLIPPTFRTTHMTNQAENLLHSHWNMTGTGDDGKFALATVTPDGPLDSTLVTQNQLNVNATGDALKTLAYDSFNVGYYISTQTSDGIIKSSDTAVATVRMLRIKGITLNATSGFASKWNDDWDGTPTDGAQGYAYTDGNGKVIDMNLNANIDCTDWIPYKGGVTWKLEKSDGSSWAVCDNPNFAKLKKTSDAASTMNTLQFGKSAMNGQLYRITATSMFDPDYSATLIVGVGRTQAVSDDGFYSRGFYIDLTSWLEQIKGVTTTVDHIDDWKDMVKGDSWEAANVEFKKDPQTGRIYIYVNYDSFSYTQQSQRVNFYDGKGEIKFYMYDADGNKIKDASGQELIEYHMQAVRVTKDAPTGKVVVVSKNGTKTVRVKTAYYNLIDKKYFGIYVDDTETNLNRASMADWHKYISVATSSPYGDVYTYVDKMSVTITPKRGSDYNPFPMRLRLSALDYYNLTRNNNTTPPSYTADSYTDYTVYIANVDGADVFIPGPNTKGADAKIDGVGVEWPASIGTESAKTNISGYDASGALKSNIGKVYTKGGKTMLDYNGTTYTYNKTYSYWKK